MHDPFLKLLPCMKWLACTSGPALRSGDWLRKACLQIGKLGKLAAVAKEWQKGAKADAYFKVCFVLLRLEATSI